MYQVYLSLGTNLGNRKRNIREVIEKIGEQIGVVERLPCGCRQLPATLLPYADKVAAICQQPCWQPPTIK